MEVGISMPSVGLSLSMPPPEPEQTLAESDPTLSSDSATLDSATATDAPDEALVPTTAPAAAPTDGVGGTSGSSSASTGDVAQTVDEGNSVATEESKSGKGTAAVIATLSVAGVALLAGVVVSKKMHQGNSDASIGGNSGTNSVL